MSFKKMKCKHCYKAYKDCSYYVADKDGCLYKKVRKISRKANKGKINTYSE